MADPVPGGRQDWVTRVGHWLYAAFVAISLVVWRILHPSEWGWVWGRRKGR